MQSRPLKKSSSYATLEDFFQAQLPTRTYLHSDEAGELVESTLDAQAAQNLSEQVGPRTRIITDNVRKKNPLLEELHPEYRGKSTLLTLGCGGKSSAGQYATANLIEKILRSKAYNVLYLMHTGDMLYDKGAASETDPIFNKVFYRPYANYEFPLLSELPITMVPGNHEGDQRWVANLQDRISPWLLGLLPPPVQGNYKVKYILSHNKMAHPDVDPVLPRYDRDVTIETEHKIFNETHRVPKTKQTLLQQEKVDVTELSKFDIDYYFGSDIIGNYQFFRMNSSTLLNEFMIYLLHITGLNPLNPEELRKNQFYFLSTEYPKCIAAGRIPVMVWHHPPVPAGARWWQQNYDSKYHMEADARIRLDRILQLPLGETDAEIQAYLKTVMEILICDIKHINKIHGIPYPTIDADNLCLQLIRLLAAHGMTFEAFLCAHDHMQQFLIVNGLKEVSQNYQPTEPVPFPYKGERADDLSNYPIVQVLSGGGGGDLQGQYNFSFGEQMGFCLNNFGVTAMTFNPDTDPKDPEPIIFDYYSINGRHLRFTNHSPVPVIAQPKPPKDRDFTDAELENYMKGMLLREIVSKACRKYQEFLNLKMKESNGTFLDSKTKAVAKVAATSVSSIFQPLKLLGNLKDNLNRNFTHKIEDVAVMNDIFALVNCHEPIKFSEAITELYRLAETLVNKDSAHSPYMMLNNAISKVKDFGYRNLEELNNAYDLPRAKWISP